MNKNKSKKWLSELLKNRIFNISVLLFLHAVVSLASVANTLQLRNIVNSVTAGSVTAFKSACLVYIAILFVQILSRYFGRHMEEETRANIENNLKHRTLSDILTSEYGAVKQIHSEEWLNRISKDTEIVANSLVVILPAISGIVVSLFASVASLYMLYRPVVLVIVPFAFMLLVFRTLSREKMKGLHNEIRITDGKFKVFTSEHLSNLEVVHTYSKENNTLVKADEIMQEHKKARMERNKFINFTSTAYSLGSNGLYLLCFVLCGRAILQGGMSVGDLMAVMLLVNHIQTPVANISAIIPQYYSMIASAERLSETENFEKDYLTHIKKRDIYSFYNTRFAGLKLENVNFTYPDYKGEDLLANGLNNFNLEIKKGEIVAFTGHSGVGKSTVIKLIAGLYRAPKGSYKLVTTGEDIEFSRDYRSLFAYVPQGNGLISGTIRDAVCFEKDNPSDEKIWNALKIACADEFVGELSDGLDSLIGEKGAGLSLGEIQRISIARAIYYDSPILLLDEITSSLDADTEYKLLQNLKNMTDKTVLIVTHRPAALEICDRVIDFEV